MKFYQKIYSAVFLLFAMVVLSSCDEHEHITKDTNIYVGQVLCADGTVKYLEDVNTETDVPIGVVFNTNNDGTKYTGKGYAVILKETKATLFADSLGFSMGTSTDMTTYSGFDNTFSMYMAGSPIAAQAMYFLPSWQSAFVPSAQEMRMLYASRAMINPVIEALGGDKLPESQTPCYYWTSTEIKGHEAMQAYTFSLSSGTFQPAIKDLPFPTRPMVVIME